MRGPNNYQDPGKTRLAVLWNYVDDDIATGPLGDRLRLVRQDLVDSWSDIILCACSVAGAPMPDPEAVTRFNHAGWSLRQLYQEAGAGPQEIRLRTSAVMAALTNAAGQRDSPEVTADWRSMVERTAPQPKSR